MRPRVAVAALALPTVGEIVDPGGHTLIAPTSKSPGVLDAPFWPGGMACLYTDLTILAKLASRLATERALAIAA
jgi:hypothetical protein